MKIIVKTGAFALCGIVAAVISAPVALADSGVYFGGNAGYTLSSYSRHTIEDAVASEFAAAGDTLTSSAASQSRSTTDWSAEVGYMLSPYVGLEASYWQLAAVHYAESGTVPGSTGTGTSAMTFTMNTHVRGPALTLRGLLPLSESWFIDAHLGAFDGRIRTAYQTSIASASSGATQSQTRTRLLAEVGSGYVLASHWTLQADVIYINRIQDPVLERNFNVTQVTAGLTYSF